MKISRSWLNRYYDSGLSTSEISNILTNTGLEVGSVEEFETFPGGLKGLVVGEVLTAERHPNADRLSVTTVNIGNGEPLNIVCGAPNVAAGQKVLVATVGATLYPTEGEPFTIKKGKIRGEESNGMICAEDEIGMGTSHEGIMVLKVNAKPGTPAAEYFETGSDEVLEVDLTPNRSDAFSHIGVARDLLAALKASGKAKNNDSLQWPDVSEFKTDDPSFPIGVSVEDSSACPRYSGVTISGVKVEESPSWLQNRLRSIGLKPINNIVDITNFVLHELGQPLHAFDADKITGGKVIVKKLQEGTSFVTLDEEERKLSSEDLMICNEEEGMCIAGIFGGLSSGVTEKTSRIFLESACFNPVSIRKTARRHGLNTDASFRFERGTDPNITVYALKRAALLMKEIAGGKITSEIVDIYPVPAENKILHLSFENADRLIGQSIDRDLIRSILLSLDINIITDNKSTLEISIPPYRTDVKREADVIEEILRIYGYNNIALPAGLRSSLSYSEGLNKDKVKEMISGYLVANGFTEIMNNSLTKSSYYKENDPETVKILNPLSSELEVLRRNLLYGALESLTYNRNRKLADVKFFEFGKTYHKKENSYKEEQRIIMVMAGSERPENWNYTERKADFFDLKKELYMVFERLGIQKHELTASEEASENLEYGLQLQMNGKNIAVTGKLAPAVAKRFDIDGAVFVADISWDSLLKIASRKEIKYLPVAKFPVVRRDLALLLDEAVKFDQIEQIAIKSEKKLLKGVQLFDVYQGKGLEPGKKSYAVSFFFGSDEKTLKDQQVDEAIKRIYRQLTQEAGATLRHGEI